MRNRPTDEFKHYATDKIAGDTRGDSVLAYSVRQATARAGVGRTLLYEAMGRGDLKARKYGRRTLILKTDLDAWLHSLSDFPARFPGGRSAQQNSEE